MAVVSRIIVGDALASLREMPDCSIQCCVTSPPYWGLRDYGVVGQIGLERTWQEYVAIMVKIFAEVRRVLRTDGTIWLNMGDSYHSGDRGGYRKDTHRWAGSAMQSKIAGSHMEAVSPNRLPQDGLKDKDLCGIPWRLAFALQADGWWLRSDIIWAKPNPMPESVTDRPTKAHEYMFLMAKSARYYYDAGAIAEAAAAAWTCVPDGWATGAGKHDAVSHSKRSDKQGEAAATASPSSRRRMAGFNDRWDASEAGSATPLTRNSRSVWTIATSPFPEAHFATFPPELARRCVAAGSRPGDLVLDPFAGAGTVGLVADRLGRDFVGIELNPKYAEMAERRIHDDAPLLSSASRALDGEGK